MAPRFQDSTQPPSRLLAWIMAVLHLVLVGMLVYFRLGPMAKVFHRFAERGTPLPSWLTLGITLGVLGMALFLGFRALAFLRAARRPPAQDPEE